MYIIFYFAIIKVFEGEKSMEHYFTNNENLKSELRMISYQYENYCFEFASDLGVFSKDKVDFGSKLLMETYFSCGRKNISLLDVGCGYGVMGVSLAKIMGVHLTMIDVNKRALHLAEMNLKKNKVVGKVMESNIYEAIDEKFDVILTNPPIRAGKAIVMEILLGARDHLKENGELWLVMRKDQGAKSAILKLQDFYTVEVLKKSKGFSVIVAKNI